MPLVVSGRDVCIGQVDGLFGLFSSLHAARRALVRAGSSGSLVITP